MTLSVKRTLKFAPPNGMISNGCPWAKAIRIIFIERAVLVHYIFVYRNIRRQFGVCCCILFCSVCKGTVDQSRKPEQLSCVADLIGRLCILLGWLECLTGGTEAVVIAVLRMLRFLCRPC